MGHHWRRTGLAGEEAAQQHCTGETNTHQRWTTSQTFLQFKNITNVSKTGQSGISMFMHENAPLYEAGLSELVKFLSGGSALEGMTASCFGKALLAAGMGGIE